MLVTPRIVGFFILFLLVTATLSIEHFVLHGAGDYASGKWNMLVSKRKTLQIKSEMRIRGRKVAYSEPDSTRTVEARKKVGTKPRISRESYEASIVAFTADYRGPRHHPPKNN